MRTIWVSFISLVVAGCVTDAEPLSEEPTPISSPGPTPAPSPSPTPPSQTPLDYDLTGKVLVVEGDELGVGAQSYAGIYATENPTLTVRNMSSEGATIGTLLARRDSVLAMKPDILSISLTLHDLCAADNPSGWLDAINGYAQPFVENGTKVVVTTPFPRDSATDDACDRRHNERLRQGNYRPFLSSYDFFGVAHFGGEDALTAPGATMDSNVFVDGVRPTAEVQKALAATYARTINNIWSVVLDRPALQAPKDDGVTIVVAEGSSSAATYGGSFHGLYRSNKANFDEWYGSAVGGSNVRKLTERIDKVLAKNPDVVSVYIGSNELHAYETVQQLTDPLRDYAVQLRARGTKVLVFTLPNRTIRGSVDHQHNTLRKQMKAVFESADWIDGFVDFAGDPIMGQDSAPLDPELFSDGLHATSYGHSLYYDAYAPVMDRVVTKQHPVRK